MLELYGPPPGKENETKGSSASVVRAPEKAPGAAEEPPAHENHQASSQSSMPGCNGPEKQNSKQKIPRNESKGGAATSNEGLSLLSPPTDAMKRMDKDTMKATQEKRGNSIGDADRKADAADGDALIERELEHGVESAAEDERREHEREQSWTNPPLGEYEQKAAGTAENTEEGDLSVDSRDCRSPEADNRKRKDVQEHLIYDGSSERDLLKRPRS